MHDVQRLLRLPRSTIRSLVHAGFVTPSRGARGAWRFSFQDLIVLRTAQALVEANVPARRITRSMRELKRRLPETMPLSGIAIGAVADQVVVREGGARWQADSGQYVLEFEADPASGAPRVIERAPARSAQSWFDEAASLEGADASAAIGAYEQAIAADPAFVDAPVNLGRLLHDRGELARAERVYREAMATCGHDPLLLFNLGVLLEDMGRREDAADAYAAAVTADPDLADAHYNLALLCEALGRPQDAIRHMARYRVLRKNK
ncbi:MAG: tetratricopeptide repeat protein [Burkholderiales bacterium]